MPGDSVSGSISIGKQIEVEHSIVFRESMKMKNAIHLPKKRAVKELPFRKISYLNADDILAVVE